MKENFNLTAVFDTYEVVCPIEYKRFSGGEMQVRISPILRLKLCCEFRLNCRLVNSDAIITMVLINDALAEMLIKQELDLPVHCTIGYLPYARQDRSCYAGEAHSSYVMALIVGCARFASVTVIDPHSEEAVESIKNKQVTTQTDIFVSNLDKILDIAGEDVMLCSPDKGAIEKTKEVYKAMGNLLSPIIQGEKIRDQDTGKLTGFGYTCSEDIDMANILIVDDICDGGGTFLGLAKVLREAGAKRIGLYVTHGIFSQGVNKLLDNGIDYLITTNTFDFIKSKEEFLEFERVKDKVTVLKVQ